MTESIVRPPRRKIPLADIVVQVVFVGLFALAVIWLARNAISAIQAMGLTTGFGFLERPRGWNIAFSALPTSASDTYLHTIAVGAVNTLLVGLCAIALATVLGFLVGVGQVSENMMLRWASRLFVGVFRNIPTIVYLVFVYALMLNVPPPKQAISLADVAFLSNRGVFLPAVNASWAGWSVAMLPIILALCVAWKRPWQAMFGDKSASARRIALAAAALMMVCLCLVAGAMGGVFDLPALKGSNFRGGMSLPLEIFSLIVALTIFGTAYIGEIVRGGLQSVPQGMTEAAQSLGLRPFFVFWHVRLPIALRSMIPAIGNQYLYLMKGTSLGMVVGFTDLFGVTQQSINFSGQTLELLAIMMGIFILINFSISRLVGWVNQRLQFKRNG